MITLPKPPPINHLYGISCRSGKAIMYKTARGKAWVEECLWLIKSQWKKREPIKGNVGVYIKFYACMSSDNDGVIKPTLDVLEDARVFENDRQVDFIQIQRITVKHRNQEKLEIEIQY